MLNRVVATTILKSLSAKTLAKPVRGFNIEYGRRALAFGFAEEKSTQVGEVNSLGESRNAIFYRNSVRRINIDTKGRGKFTQHHLIRLTKLTLKPQEQQLLFEAYFNYMGHFTIIESRVVDRMLTRVMSFERCNLQKILQIYSNHNYLSYFPHYSITKQLLGLASADQQIFAKLLKILIDSPLIKFDAQIVQDLLKTLKTQTLTHSNLSLIVKLLISRQNHKLLDTIITRQQLSNHFVAAFQAAIQNKIYKPFQRSSSVSQWIIQTVKSQQSSDYLHLNLAILALTSSLGNLFSDQLILIKQQQAITKALSFLTECPQSYRNFIVKYLQSLQITQELRGRLSELAVIDNSVPSQTQ